MKKRIVLALIVLILCIGQVFAARKWTDYRPGVSYCRVEGTTTWKFWPLAYAKKWGESKVAQSLIFYDVDGKGTPTHVGTSAAINEMEFSVDTPPDAQIVNVYFSFKGYGAVIPVKLQRDDAMEPICG